MSKYQKLWLALLRVSMGWMMFYAGITKVLDPKWSAGFYFKDSQVLPGLFHWFGSAGVLPIVNFASEWGLTLLGVSLILGIGVRLSSVLGALLMFLFYLPILKFPYPNAHAYIVDEHIIYMFALLYFAAVRAGRVYGLEKWCENLPICRKLPGLHNWWG